LIEGEINIVCLLDWTMTRDKDTIHGVLDCDIGTIALFSLVRR
jgi:hypothetical protein